MVDAKIREVMSGKQLDEGPDEIMSIMEPLLSTSKALIIRPVAYPSALLCLAAAHKLVMLIEMVEVPREFEDTRREWVRFALLALTRRLELPHVVAVVVLRAIKRSELGDGRAIAW